MWDIVTSIFSENLGMSFATILYIIYLIVGMVWFAVDYKVGIVMLILIGFGFFVWMYSTDQFFGRFLVTVIIGIVLLGFNLYAAAKFKYGSGLI